MTNKVTVISFVLAPHGLSLFLANGSSVTIRASDYRINELVQTLTEGQLSQGFSEVELSTYAVTKRLEQGLNGIRFCTSQPGTPLPHLSQPADLEGDPPVGHTFYAVVDGTYAVEGIEKIKDLILHHLNSGTLGALENLIRRVGKVERAFSISSTLEFLSKAKLALTAQGDILAYRVVRREGDFYVDKHTGKVTQSLHWTVRMNPAEVDASLDISCSAGLHVCSAKYIRSFYNTGDALTLVLVRPEDIIAVPRGESEKVRSAAYTILYEFNKKDTQSIISGGVAVDTKFVRFVDQVLSGNYPPVLAEQYIGGSKGTDLRLTEFERKPSKAQPKEVTVKELKTLNVADAKKKGAANTTKLVKEIRKALKKPGATKTQVAEDFGMSIRTLNRRIGFGAE